MLYDAGFGVGVGGIGVAVGGAGVAVGCGVGVGGTGVAVGAGVGVGGTGVGVAGLEVGIGVAVDGFRVAVGVEVAGLRVGLGGTGVAVDGFGVAVGSAVGFSGTGVGVRVSKGSSFGSSSSDEHAMMPTERTEIAASARYKGAVCEPLRTRRIKVVFDCFKCDRLMGVISQQRESSQLELAESTRLCAS